MDDTPQHLLDYDRQRDRALEQEEAEREPDYALRFAKPARRYRYRATKDEWINFHEWRAEQGCWICGAPATNTHHIYPRGQGGDDRLENFAALCGSGTTGCHGRIETRDPVARARLRLALRDENLLYLSAKLGPQHARAWLDRNYPTPELSEPDSRLTEVPPPRTGATDRAPLGTGQTNTDSGSENFVCEVPEWA